MKRTYACACWMISVLLVLVEVSAAQVATGTPPFSSLGGGPFDVIDLGNLNAHFAVPVIHKAGRAGYNFTYDLSYDSSIWTQVTSNGTPTWTPDINWGWRGLTEAATGYITSKANLVSCPNPDYPPARPPTLRGAYYNNFRYHDRFGMSHPFNISVEEDGCDQTGPVSGLATDGSGYTLTADVGTSNYVTSRSGDVTYPPVGTNGGAGIRKDANGNEITVNNSGQFFDTLSSTTPVLTVTGSGTPSSPLNFTYAAPSGSAQYAMNYVQYTVHTNFGVKNSGGTSIAEYGPTSVALVDNITLPDGSKYSFTYEQTPGSCTPLSGTYQSYCVTGRIASVTLPPGGQITYAYTGGPNSTGIFNDGSTAGLNRTLSPGGPWQYARTQVSGAHWQTQVTSPPDPVNPGSASDVTVIDFEQDGNTTTYNFYETQRLTYQGGHLRNALKHNHRLLQRQRSLDAVQLRVDRRVVSCASHNRVSATPQCQRFAIGDR